MKHELSTLEVVEWGPLSLLMQSVSGFMIGEKLPRYLTFSHRIESMQGNRLPLSITWTYKGIRDGVPIFTYVGITRAVIEKENKISTIEEIYQLVHNMFFQFTMHIYWEWQTLDPLSDPFPTNIDDLQNRDIFDIVDQIRERLGMR